MASGLQGGSKEAAFHVVHPREPAIGEGRTVRFEGETYGSGVSFFIVENEPGQGPDLHVHPYSETWIVRKGEARFTVGAQTTHAVAGDVVVVAPHTPHGFKNVGTDRLEIICIHASSRIIQAWVEG
jgi:quercetin dioxygenase-like cupin family protein